MQFKTAKKWGLVPYGTWIIMSHPEACDLTSGKSVGAITAAISAIGTVYAAAAAAAIHFQMKYIREMNEKSGGAGVKLLFVWVLGVITTVNRRGSGSSPCASVTGESSGSGSGTGAGAPPGGVVDQEHKPYKPL